MFSNKKEDCDHYWGINQGADAYLSKPCHPQELVNTVQYFLAEGIISPLVPTRVSESISISAGLARTADE